MPAVRVDDCDVYYALTGHAGAPVVLLLHGLGSSGDDWALQTPALAARYRVLAVDLPGHHRSGRLRGRLSISRMATTVAHVLDTLAIEHAHAVGLSLGGCVALALALEAPGRVRSLVLVNTFARLRPSGPRAALRGAGRLLLALAAPMPVLARYVTREAFPGADQAALRQAAVERLASNSRWHGWQRSGARRSSSPAAATPRCRMRRRSSSRVRFRARVSPSSKARGTSRNTTGPRPSTSYCSRTWRPWNPRDARSVDKPDLRAQYSVSTLLNRKEGE